MSSLNRSSDEQYNDLDTPDPVYSNDSQGCSWIGLGLPRGLSPPGPERVCHTCVSVKIWRSYKCVYLSLGFLLEVSQTVTRRVC